MSNHASQLPLLFRLFSVSSVFTSIGILVAPEKLWKFYGHSGEGKSISSICYAGALMGEATLQYLAAVLPRSFLAPAIMFMIPYKLVSSLGLLWHAQTLWDSKAQREVRLVALMWFSPLVLIGAALHLTHEDHRNHYLSV